MTSDPKLVAQATARIGPGGGDNPEAHNVVFRNSYRRQVDRVADGLAQARVVVGDAEPHGAGSAGPRGLPRRLGDPHALRVRQELLGMKVNGRMLIIALVGRAAEPAGSSPLPHLRAVRRRTTRGRRAEAAATASRRG